MAGLNIDYFVKSGFLEDGPDFFHRGWRKGLKSMMSPHLVELVDNHGSAGLGHKLHHYTQLARNVPTSRSRIPQGHQEIGNGNLLGTAIETGETRKAKPDNLASDELFQFVSHDHFHNAPGIEVLPPAAHRTAANARPALITGLGSTPYITLLNEFSQCLHDASA